MGVCASTPVGGVCGAAECYGVNENFGDRADEQALELIETQMQYDEHDIKAALKAHPLMRRLPSVKNWLKELEELERKQHWAEGTHNQKKLQNRPRPIYFDEGEACQQYGVQPRKTGWKSRGSFGGGVAAEPAKAQHEPRGPQKKKIEKIDQVCKRCDIQVRGWYLVQDPPAAGADEPPPGRRVLWRAACSCHKRPALPCGGRAKTCGEVFHNRKGLKTAVVVECPVCVDAILGEGHPTAKTRGCEDSSSDDDSHI